MRLRLFFAVIRAFHIKANWAESLGITQVEFLSDFEPKGEVAKKYGVFIDEKGFGGACGVCDR